MNTTSAELREEAVPYRWPLTNEDTRTIAAAVSRLVLPLALMGAMSAAPTDGATVVRQHEGVFVVVDRSGTATFRSSVARSRPISELGWTVEQAAAMRHKLGAFAQDWDDPAMDVYDAL
jgi:hypothetical protein